MKTIKNCKWKVKVFNNSYGQWYWSIFMPEDCGVADIIGGDPSSSRKEAKHNWECFAKINDIKKWRYI